MAKTNGTSIEQAYYLALIVHLDLTKPEGEQKLNTVADELAETCNISRYAALQLLIQWIDDRTAQIKAAQLN